MLKLISFLFLSVFTAQIYANEPFEQFSYCSNGSCRLITTDYFFYSRDMPRDLNFSCRQNNQYALTFDDGPSENYPKLLEILKKHDVKATFFVVGSNLKNDRAHELYEQMVKEGHFVANHTFEHLDLTSLSFEDVQTQIERSRSALRTSYVLQNVPMDLVKNLDKSTKYVRPPFGNINSFVDQIFKINGYISVRWNSDKYDWDMPPTSESAKVIVNRVIQHLDFIDSLRAQNVIFNQSILDLNHDFQNSTLKALDEYIPMIKSRGYTFVTLDECLQIHRF